MTDSPSCSLDSLPVDVMAEIAGYLLSEEPPEGPPALVPSSNLNRESGWCTPCPPACKHGELAATIGGRLLYRPLRHTTNQVFVMNLAGVNRSIRARMLDLRGIWGRGGLPSSHPKLLNMLARRAQPLPMDIVSAWPPCGCCIPHLLRWLHLARRISLTLPAHTPKGPASSIAFCAELRATALHLDFLELRFATPAERLPDVEAQYPVPNPRLSSVRLLNAHFTFVGPSVRSLHLGQQSAQLRWSAASICAVILACPMLEDLALHTVIKPHIETIHPALLPADTDFNGTIDTSVATLPQLAPQHLLSLYLSDDASTCMRLLRQFSPIHGDFHVDAVVQLGSDDIDQSQYLDPVLETLQPLLTTCRRHFEAGELGKTVITTYIPDRGGPAGAQYSVLWKNWPERVFVGLAMNEEDALLMSGDSADFAPLPGRRRCSFAIRNDATSIRWQSDVVRTFCIIPPPRAPLVMQGMFRVLRDMFQLRSTKMLILPADCFLPTELADWPYITQNFQEVEVISIASRIGRTHKTFAHHLRRRPRVSTTFPLPLLREIKLPAYSGDAQGVSSWNTKDLFNLGMRRQMERSERTGVLKWNTPLLPD